MNYKRDWSSTSSATPPHIKRHKSHELFIIEELEAQEVRPSDSSAPVPTETDTSCLERSEQQDLRAHCLGIEGAPRELHDSPITTEFCGDEKRSASGPRSSSEATNKINNISPASDSQTSLFRDLLNKVKAKKVKPYSENDDTNAERA